MNRKLLIIGAGGHGRVVFEIAETTKMFDEISFLDDNSEIAIGRCDDYISFLDKYKYAFVAIGNNKVRKEWIEKLLNAGFSIPNIIHETAYISPTAKLETGIIIMPNAVINSNTFIKKGCIIGIGSLVDHDIIIEECCHINSGAVVKAGSKVDELIKIDANMVFENK